MACHVALATGADACCCRRYACAACFSVASPHQSPVSAGAKIVISAVGASLTCHVPKIMVRAPRATLRYWFGAHTHSCTAASRRSGQCRERPDATNKNCVILCKTAQTETPSGSLAFASAPRAAWPPARGAVSSRLACRDSCREVLVSFSILQRLSLVYLSMHASVGVSGCLLFFNIFWRDSLLAVHD